MKIKIINDLDIKKQAKDLGLSVWNTPSFLFLLMGVIVISAMTATYFIAKNYDSPEALVLSESLVAIVILVIGNSVIRGVEEVARLNKMKSEFISVASHQLKTPLSAIKWELELLTSKYGKGLCAKQLNNIETISTQTARMIRLVNDLLDVARIDQGRMVLKKERVDINETIFDVINNLMPLCRSKNIKVFFKEKKNTPPVVGDREKIALVLENILGNAIKYVYGRGKIEVSTQKSGNKVIVSVKDNGVGVPSGQRKQIFEKFFRSDNAVKYQTEGTGLGLYIAKNIIEQSGGKIWLKSEEDVGSVFSFSLNI